ncbi:MAG: hypothetical protein GY757_25880, partial [bacterium]|nr:hypothetical protein [bacterium]
KQAHYIKTSAKEKYIALEEEEKRDYYAVSPAQKRIYILQQLTPGSAAYNIPAVSLLEGKPDRTKIENIFFRLLERHQGLRTTFKMEKGEPVQIIKENVEFQLETGDTQHRQPGDGAALCEKIVTEFIRPFQLDRAPLLRVQLTEIKNDEHLLVVDVHHIVSDGASMGIV